MLYKCNRARREDLIRRDEKMVTLPNYRRTDLNHSWRKCHNIDDFMRYVKSVSDSYNDYMNNVQITSIEDAKVYDIAHISKYYQGDKSYKMLFMGQSESGKSYYAIMTA
jgi:hypothetical protein